MPRVKRSRTISSQKPTCANELGYLTGYRDTGSGGLSFGEDHQSVKNPANVYTVDRAFIDARTPKTGPVCEVRGCSAGATYGANHPKALAKRCPAHREEKHAPVMCAVAGCTQTARVRHAAVHRENHRNGQSRPDLPRRRYPARSHSLHQLDDARPAAKSRVFLISFPSRM